jgi:hypothetical protein
MTSNILAYLLHSYFIACILNTWSLFAINQLSDSPVQKSSTYLLFLTVLSFPGISTIKFKHIIINTYKCKIIIYICVLTRGVEWALHESELVSLASDHEVPGYFGPQHLAEWEPIRRKNCRAFLPRMADQEVAESGGWLPL